MKSIFEYVNESKKVIELDQSNYDKVKNVTVEDQNGNVVKIGKVKRTLNLGSEDGQESYSFIEFDNGTTIQVNRSGETFVSNTDLDDEIDFYFGGGCFYGVDDGY